MAKTQKSQMTFNPSIEDATALDELAKRDRRKPADMIRIILEDVVDGRIDIDDIDDTRIERVHTSVGVKQDFKERFEAFRAAKGLSRDKVLHYALKKLKQAA